MFYVNKNDKLILTLQRYGCIKDTDIGYCKLKFNKLPDNTAIDMKLPLNNSKIQLHIVAKFTPYIYNKKYSHKLKSIRINLERNFYFPGETVRGHVIINTNKPYEIENIILEFISQSYVYFIETYGETVYVDQSSYHYSDRQVILYRTDPNSPSTYTILKAGTYIYPFEYVLNVNLPPSYTHEYYGLIIHYFSCYASTKSKSSELINRVPIYIVKPYDPPKILYQRSYSISSKHNINLSITKPDIIFTGEDTELNVKIENNSKKAIEKVIIKIVKVALFGARLGGYRTSKSDIMITSENIKNSLPLKPGSKIDDTIKFTLNEYEPQSLTGKDCPNINVCYHIKVTAITEGSVFTRVYEDLITPITVVKRHADLRRIIPYPVEPESCPNQFKISKMITSSYNDLLPPTPHEIKARFYKNDIVPKDVFYNNLMNDVIQENIDFNLNSRCNFEDLKIKLSSIYEKYFIKSEPPKEIDSEPIEDKGAEGKFIYETDIDYNEHYNTKIMNLKRLY